MNIGDSLRRWRDLARLRARARKAQSPAAWSDLAERLIAVGDVDEALANAEAGLRRFPDSERLASVRLFARRKKVSAEIRRLREETHRRASPAAYTQLAAIYRGIGSSDEALDAARECADRFPLHEGAHILQAEIRIERFVEDLVARDAVLAAEALRRAEALNPREPRAQLLQAELCWLVGDVAGCRARLEAVLALAPGESALADLLVSLAGDEIVPADEPPSFEDLAQQVEERGVLARPAEQFPGAARAAGGSAKARSAALDVEALKAHVAELSSRPGVRASVVLDRDRQILADTNDGATSTRREFAELVTALCATADDAGRRMDTGALVRAELETEEGCVTAARVRGVTVGVRYDGTLRPADVWETLQDLVARCLPAAEEGRRA